MEKGNFYFYQGKVLLGFKNKYSFYTKKKINNFIHALFFYLSRMEIFNLLRTESGLKIFTNKYKIYK